MSSRINQSTILRPVFAEQQIKYSNVVFKQIASAVPSPPNMPEIPSGAHIIWDGGVIGQGVKATAENEV